MPERPEDRLLPRLRGVVQKGDGHWRAYCPIHETNGHHDPSLDVTRAADGKLLLYCQVCKDSASAAQICQATGLTVSELYPERLNGHHRRNGRPKGKVVATYDYIDADGVLRYQVCRMEPKDFRQRRPNGQGGWVWNIRGVGRVLYRLPQLLAADKSQPVFVVEGEKDVDRLITIGIIATTNVGGAGKWAKSYSVALRDRDVVIVSDNDQAGRDHAAKVLLALSGIAKSVKVVDLSGLPDRGDVSDWLDAGGTKDGLLSLANATPVGQGPVATESASPADPLCLLFPDARTDVANGRRLARSFGEDIRYCHPWGKWFVWDGRRWKEDDTGDVERKSKTIADEIWKEARKLSENGLDEAEFMKLLKFARDSSSSRMVGNMVSEAASEPGLQIIPDWMDGNPWVINCLNGTIDLTNGTLRPHDRADNLTRLVNVEFDPSATCPAWDRFLWSIFGGQQDLIDYVQRLCGYWTTGIVREQMLAILWGGGSNGKTTFLNTFMGILGDGYSMKAPTDFLMTRRGESHPTEKADLFAKRFVACSETEEGRRLNESLVKELTGSERIRARRMRQDFWEFAPTHKIALVTNHKPVIAGTDTGIWRRLRLIPFQRFFWDPDTQETGPEELRQDKQLPEKLAAERSGILTWMVQGCIEWLNHGEQVPQSVLGHTADYRASQDILGAFLSENCITGESYQVKASDLYESYKSWCEATGEFFVSQRKFGLAMTERGFERYLSSGTWYRRITIAVHVP